MLTGIDKLYIIILLKLILSMLLLVFVLKYVLSLCSIITLVYHHEMQINWKIISNE